jgi:tRNA-Thr(GGU) m(6)t(6)A37 methyltransferase TsaA
MIREDQFLLRPVGTVRSPLKSREDCPKQGWEGAPEAWLEIDAVFADALDGLSPGQEIFVLTWLHQGRREVLRVHPRGDLQESLRGVFATRSPDRPNPIGLHRVAVVAIEPTGRLRVRPLEAVDGTPILDIKPVITGPKER